MLEQFLTESNIICRLFCYLIHMLFQHSGIVLMDSHHPELRRLEAPFFNKLVSENELLRAAFVEQADLFYEKGFGEPIARSKENTHLFYHTSEGRRILLLKQENGSYVDRDRQYLFDEDQLRLLVEREPEKFSNNVVTRPLMQEFLFPVLAFVAGPGEIAYWATLKKTFHLFGFKVPPVVPRFSMTFIDAKIDKYLKTLNIPLSIVFEKGAKSFWEKAVFEGVAEEIDEALLRVMGDLKAAQLPLVELVEKYEIGLSDMAAKNLKLIQNQVQFLANRVKKGVREKKSKTTFEIRDD
ncbi:MAG: bacillithiol biosynthesis cysteine-adding enzyme BshC [Bacillaceae bacterium]|nr:bacillithiol biosynthesis cysteine-adding enzyme BshC [Bacillaceae bacterium]